MKLIVRTVALVLALSFGYAHAQSTNTNVGIGDPLPDFKFEKTDGTWITKGDLPADQPVIVFYFDPFCDHCQKEAGWITENQDLFKGITLLWASWGEMKDIVEFPKKYLPGVGGDLYITRDTEFAFDNYFGYSEIPSVYVYNKEWARTASFNAETKPEILVKFARQ